MLIYALDKFGMRVKIGQLKKKRFKLEYNINGERQMKRKIDSLDLTLPSTVYIIKGLLRRLGRQQIDHQMFL